jgi:hypothetical protein
MITALISVYVSAIVSDIQTLLFVVLPRLFTTMQENPHTGTPAHVESCAH